MPERIRTPLEATSIVASALDAYRNQHRPLGEEIAEIQSTASVPRIRLKLKSGETFVIDITREPKPRPTRQSL